MNLSVILSAVYDHDPWIKIHFSTIASKIFLYDPNTNTEFWTYNKVNVSVYKDKKCGFLIHVSRKLKIANGPIFISQ